jgi:hypothetical protein
MGSGTQELLLLLQKYMTALRLNSYLYRYTLCKMLFLSAHLLSWRLCQHAVGPCLDWITVSPALVPADCQQTRFSGPL